MINIKIQKYNRNSAVSVAKFYGKQVRELQYLVKRRDLHKQQTRSSAVAEIARVTISIFHGK